MSPMKFSYQLLPGRPIRDGDTNLKSYPVHLFTTACWVVTHFLRVPGSISSTLYNNARQ